VGSQLSAVARIRRSSSVLSKPLEYAAFVFAPADGGLLDDDGIERLVGSRCWIRDEL
jgi:hypothetical protein